MLSTSNMDAVKILRCEILHCVQNINILALYRHCVPMDITLLGTGTSHGVPMIGCDCDVCRSMHPRNHRTRSAAYIDAGDSHILIDTPPDLRTQILRECIDRVDAILFTHAHADHIFGLDDVRTFNKLSGRPMRCYGSTHALSVIRRIFDYAFGSIQIGGGIPQLDLIEVQKAFDVDGVTITPIPVEHGRFNVLGYRIDDFAYVTDCNHIPDESAESLRDLDVLVLGVLRPKKRTTHFSLEQGLEVVDWLKPRRAILTHTSHRMDYESISEMLPPNVEFGYDGMKIIC